jgi:uncharacterized protein (TIGR02145 family)
MNSVKYLLQLVGLSILLLSCRKNEIPAIAYGTISDIDGNRYKTVKIGDQWWMAENLKTTKLNNGDIIPGITDNVKWAVQTSPAYCWYGDHSGSFAQAYGAYYCWFAVKTGKLCPVGWHVPKESEWNQLSDFSGGKNIAGGKLKSKSSGYWKSPNTGASDEVGFNALPGGFRNFSGAYASTGEVGYWWLAEQFSNSEALFRCLTFDSIIMYEGYIPKQTGMPVRCIKD